VNHTRFPEDDHLPDWARRDNKVTKFDRAQDPGINVNKICIFDEFQQIVA